MVLTHLRRLLECLQIPPPQKPAVLFWGGQRPATYPDVTGCNGQHILLCMPAGRHAQRVMQILMRLSPSSGDAMGSSEAKVEGATGCAGSKSGTSGAPWSCRLNSACLVAAVLLWRTALSSANFGRLFPALASCTIHSCCSNICHSSAVPSMLTDEQPHFAI